MTEPIEEWATHPVADLFPMMTGTDFDAFVEDISTNGLREPIWLHRDGSIIDGRNRYRACREAGIEPETQTYEGDDAELVGFVLSMNLRRRHLSESQRMMVASRIANLEDGQKKEGAQICAPAVSQPEAAKLMNVSRRGVQQAVAIQKKGAEALVDAVDRDEIAVSAAAPIAELPRDEQEHALDMARKAAAEGKVTAPIARVAVEAVKAGTSMGIHYSSNSVEWYTPKHIVDAAVTALGGVDLDPCSPGPDEAPVPAESHYTKEDDGLDQTWSGRVYMNPPYGRGIGDWTEKLQGEYRDGNVTSAIALLPARTDAEWFSALRDYPRCFVWGRLKFSESDNAAPFPSVVVYFGDDDDAFKEAFADIGDTFVLAD